MRVITSLVYAIVVSAGHPHTEMPPSGIETYNAPPPEYVVEAEDTAIQSNAMTCEASLPPPSSEILLHSQLTEFWDAIEITVSPFQSLEEVRTTRDMPKAYYWFETYNTNKPRLMSILKTWTDPSLAVEGDDSYFLDRLRVWGDELDSAEPFGYFYPTDMAIDESINTIRKLSATAPTYETLQVFHLMLTCVS